MEHRTPDRSPTTHVVLPDGLSIYVEPAPTHLRTMPSLWVYTRPADPEPVLAITPGPASGSELLSALAEAARTWAADLEEAARIARAVEDTRAQLAAEATR